VLHAFSICVLHTALDPVDDDEHSIFRVYSV
jgi:hypothetical protein